MIYKGEIILKYNIEYPQIEGFYNFNIFNYNKALKLQQKCENELFNQAKDTYEYNKENKYPLMVFEIVSKYMITYNYNNIVSLYIDEYIFTGGAHGNTIRTSQTWNTLKKERMKIEKFFNNNPNYISKILGEINKQIENNIKMGNNFYFDNYCCLTASEFRVENYYINKDNEVIIYYQQYAIGPYSSGILIFLI